MERSTLIVTQFADPLRSLPADGFLFTEAVRPTPGVPLRPKQGYRIERFRDPVSRLRIPLLAAAVSAESLFEVFMAILSPLGDVVDVVFESSHFCDSDCHEDLRRSDIDLPVLRSHLWDYEDLLLRDGCAGVAVVSIDQPVEVQFDEHKLLYVYAEDLSPFRRILKSLDVHRDDGLPLIAEAEHVHLSSPGQAERFRQMCMQVGADESDPVLSDGWTWFN